MCFTFSCCSETVHSAHFPFGELVIVVKKVSLDRTLLRLSSKNYLYVNIYPRVLQLGFGAGIEILILLLQPARLWNFHLDRLFLVYTRHVITSIIEHDVAYVSGDSYFQCYDLANNYLLTRTLRVYMCVHVESSVLNGDFLRLVDIMYFLCLR